MNRVILIGNLAADPEARTTQNGKSVVSFRLAVQRDFANAQGVREADFIACQAWGHTAEYVRQYQSKGSRVAVEGRLQIRSYDAQDGSKRTVAEVICDRVEGLQRRNTQDDAQKNRTEAQAANGGFTEMPPYDEELPF